MQQNLYNELMNTRPILSSPHSPLDANTPSQEGPVTIFRMKFKILHPFLFRTSGFVQLNERSLTPISMNITSSAIRKINNVLLL